ncbi:hypothetical protein [Aquimarina sp. RZ0]|uniref:hypothetical protein n=1 Tax=Aquimarina sp. RZ0 TaxID=2607730 RepID=UPI0011F13EC7|nr:hypothetical protein [Aquimarina sp. RZ0]KAA1243506.1 hypothetical protein F0000_20695 [Aquimarina sp. RZ0]
MKKKKHYFGIALLASIITLSSCQKEDIAEESLVSDIETIEEEEVEDFLTPKSSGTINTSNRRIVAQFWDNWNYSGNTRNRHILFSNREYFTATHETIRSVAIAPNCMITITGLDKRKFKMDRRGKGAAYSGSVDGRVGNNRNLKTILIKCNDTHKRFAGKIYQHGNATGRQLPIWDNTRLWHSSINFFNDNVGFFRPASHSIHKIAIFKNGDVFNNHPKNTLSARRIGGKTKGAFRGHMKRRISGIKVSGKSLNLLPDINLGNCQHNCDTHHINSNGGTDIDGCYDYCNDKHG